MAEKGEEEESESAEQGKLATDFKIGSEPSLASSEAQKNQEGGSPGATPDQASMQRSNIHMEDSRMADKGKQEDPDRVAKEEPGNDSETVIDTSSERTEEKKNSQRVGARESTSVKSLGSSSSAPASDLDRPPARVISLVKETRRVVNDALKNVTKVQKMNTGDLWNAKSASIRKFLESSANLFRHIHRKLQESNPEKEKFPVLIVTDDDKYILLHKSILSRTGNWDVQEVETGEAVIESHIDGTSFDLIILHHDLVGLDGPRVTDWLRDHDVKTLIAGVSAFDRGSPEREAFLKIGLNFCLKKPVLYDEDIMGAVAMEFEMELYDYIRGKVNNLGNIVSDMERILEMCRGGSSSRRRKNKRN